MGDTRIVFAGDSPMSDTEWKGTKGRAWRFVKGWRDQALKSSTRSARLSYYRGSNFDKLTSAAVAAYLVRAGWAQALDLRNDPTLQLTDIGAEEATGRVIDQLIP